MIRNIALALHGIKEFDIDHRIIRPDGKVLWMHAQAEVFRDADGHAQAVLASVIDITKRKTVELQVQRLTQLYAALGQCSQSILHCATEAELLPQVCRDAVDIGGLKMAWIGKLNPETNVLQPVAVYGDGDDYVKAIRIALDREPGTGYGPAAAAFLSDQPFWCQDFGKEPRTLPWRERAESFGWHASASLPLHCKDATVGIFNLYAGDVEAFDPAVQDLLRKMAADISFALDRFATEVERQRNEERIQYLANFDLLTGLPNRAQLEQNLRYGISPARRARGKMAMMFIDLDRF